MNSFLQTIDPAGLTETDWIIYDYLLKNEQNAAWMTLEDLCSKIYVSNASVVRFCQHIGLKGFNELKFKIRNSHNAPDESMYHIISRQLAQFNDFLSSIRQEDIEKIYQLIRSHRTFCIYGRNMSSVPATYLYDMLMSIDFHCILINWSDALKVVAQNADGDMLLLMISDHAHRGYYPIVEKFKSKGASIIWLCGEDIQKEALHNIDLFIQADTRVSDSDPLTKINSLVIIQLIIEYMNGKR